MEILIDVEQQNEQPIESEIHFLFSCTAYSKEREDWFAKMTLPRNFQDLAVKDKLSIVLNKSENVKVTSQFIVMALDARSRALNSAK